jgi:hypothetical protein
LDVFEAPFNGREYNLSAYHKSTERNMRKIYRDVFFGWVVGLFLIAVTLDCAQAEESAKDPKGKKAFSKHHIALFTGYATKDTKKRKEGFKVGLEYEYQFHKMFGVRGFADYEGGDLDTWLSGGGIAFHVPQVPIIAFVGVAFEFGEGKREEFLRIMGEYKFKLKRKLYIAPAVGYDYGRRDKSVLFAGLEFGTSF